MMLIHYSGSKLGLEHSLGVPVLLTSSDQSINGYVMCDGIGKFSGIYYHMVSDIM